jgi:pyruvate formate lyase activating enzyme
MSNNGTKAMIFHIIHGSFVDGHGVRTTVFLKGCPLRCIWCCNPEGQAGHAELKYTENLCNSCAKCIEVCPVNAIKLAGKEQGGKAVIDRKLCTNCGKCVDVCFTGALEIWGKYMTVDELFNVVRKDESFYRSSGGGVTIGGGEPTFQPQFVHEFMKKCRDNYIHTALDTTGYTPNPEANKVIEEADLLLYDVKSMDPEEHLRCTRAPLQPILDNMKRLDNLGIEIIIRMPLIPGYNAGRKNIKAAAEFLARLKHVTRVDLLPYHEFGKVKYGQLGRLYIVQSQTPTQEYMDEAKETMEKAGLRCQIGG